jgi:hypothetical protein
LIEPSTDEPSQPMSTPNSPTSTTSTSSTLDFECEGRSKPAHPPPSPSTTIPECGPSKTSKWAGLPPRKPSGRMRVTPMRFSDEATPDELDVALNSRNVNRAQAFVTYICVTPPCTSMHYAHPM